MKKILSILLSVTLCLSGFCVIASASNYSPANATTIHLGDTLMRQYTPAQQSSYYRFVLNNETDISANVSDVPMFHEFTMDIMKDNMVIASRTYTEGATEPVQLKLGFGIYYIRVNNLGMTRMEGEELEYKVTLEESSAIILDEYENGNNNIHFFDTSSLTEHNRIYQNLFYANLHDITDTDIYMFSVEYPKLITDIYASTVKIKLYDADLNLVGETTSETNGYLYAELTQGDYYLEIVKPEGYYINHNYNIELCLGFM